MQIINAKEIKDKDRDCPEHNNLINQETTREMVKKKGEAESTPNFVTDQSADSAQSLNCIDAEPISNGFDSLKNLIDKIDVAVVSVDDDGEPNEGERS